MTFRRSKPSFFFFFGGGGPVLFAGGIQNAMLLRLGIENQLKQMLEVRLLSSQVVFVEFFSVSGVSDSGYRSNKGINGRNGRM